MPKSTALEPITAENAVSRARKGDQAALAFLEATPASAAIWKGYGDLVRHVEQAYLEVMTAKDDLVVRESLRRKVATLKTELNGPTPTPLETLLVDRIAICWLAVNYAESCCAQGMGKDDLTRAWREYGQRRLDRAQHRYLSAIRTLAAVRRLDLPAIQVNVAHRQVNIATGSAPTDELAGDLETGSTGDAASPQLAGVRRPD